jgi:hypothetical protein
LTVAEPTLSTVLARAKAHCCGSVCGCEPKEQGDDYTLCSYQRFETGFEEGARLALGGLDGAEVPEAWSPVVVEQRGVGAPGVEADVVASRSAGDGGCVAEANVACTARILDWLVDLRFRQQA